MAQKKKFSQDQKDDFSDSDDNSLNSDQDSIGKIKKDKKQGSAKQPKGIDINKLKNKDAGLLGQPMGFGRGRSDDFGGGLGLGGMGGMGGFGGFGGMSKFGSGFDEEIGGGMGREKARDHEKVHGTEKKEKKKQQEKVLKRVGRTLVQDDDFDRYEKKDPNAKLGEKGYGGFFGDRQFGGGYGNKFKEFDLDIRGLYFSGKSKPKQKKPKVQGQQEQQQEQTEQQRLLRITKKLDIPQQQQITLVDWKIRGSSAQVIRLVMEYILIPYKEKKYDFLTKDQWYKIDQPNLQKTYPYLQLPYLEDGQKIIYGTEAIIIHLLHKYNRIQLLGTTNDNKVRLYTIAAIYWQILQDYLQLCYGEYEQDLPWEKIKEKYINQRFRMKLNKILNYMKNRYSGTGELLWIDFAVYEMIALLNDMDYPFREYNIQIQNYLYKMQVIPQFIVYKRSYRYHERPYNGFGAIYK